MRALGACPLEEHPLAFAGPTARAGPMARDQGVEPWPNQTSQTDVGLADLPSSTTRAHAVVAGSQVYLGLGSRIYTSVALDAATWSSWSQVANLGAGVTIGGLAYYAGDVLVCCGTTAPVKVLNTGTNAVTTLASGEQGTHAVGYAGQVAYAPASGGKHKLKLTVTRYDGTLTIREKALDSPITRLALMAGKIAIATKSSLYMLGGEAEPGSAGGDPVRWSADPEPIFSHGIWSHEEDFAFLLGFGGKLYTWLANRVMEWDPSQSRDRWRAVGPAGQTCYGACVAAGYLLVAVIAQNGEAELWAFDGSGWWRITRAAVGGAVPVWPISLAGAGDRDALAFRAGANTYDLFRLVHRSASIHTYRTSGEWVSSLLDCGHRDRPKAWRKIGAVFAVPEPRGAAVGGGSVGDAVTIAAHVSLDGGATWTEVETMTTTDQQRRTVELDAELAASESRWLQLKVTWDSVSDWAPVLVGVWAEYELLETPARRRKWRFSVIARDGQARRDGQVQPRSGRQLSLDLWTAWETGSTVSFRDLDYDHAPVQRQTRIVGIAEEIAKPADAARWGQSTLALTLVEV